METETESRDRLRGLEKQRCCSVAPGYDTLHTHKTHTHTPTHRHAQQRLLAECDRVDVKKPLQVDKVLTVYSGIHLIAIEGVYLFL